MNYSRAFQSLVSIISAEYHVICITPIEWKAQMYNLNYVAITLATLAQFVVGAIWYMPLFGNMWRKIHHIGKPTEKEMKEIQATMGPYILLQLFFTAITTIVLAKLIILLPNISPYELAFKGWLGFIVPTQVSAVIFGGTDQKWIVTKIGIMAGGSFACMLVAASIFSMMR